MSELANKAVVGFVIGMFGSMVVAAIGSTHIFTNTNIGAYAQFISVVCFAGVIISCIIGDIFDYY